MGWLERPRRAFTTVVGTSPVLPAVVPSCTREADDASAPVCSLSDSTWSLNLASWGIRSREPGRAGRQQGATAGSGAERRARRLSLASSDGRDWGGPAGAETSFTLRRPSSACGHERVDAQIAERVAGGIVPFRGRGYSLRLRSESYHRESATGKTELLPMTELLPRRNCFPNRRSRRLDVSEGADACSVMTSRLLSTECRSNRRSHGRRNRGDSQGDSDRNLRLLADSRLPSRHDHRSFAEHLVRWGTLTSAAVRRKHTP